MPESRLLCYTLLLVVVSICLFESAYAQISSSATGVDKLLPTTIVTNPRQIYPRGNSICSDDVECAIDCPPSHSYECINTMCRCSFGAILKGARKMRT